MQREPLLSMQTELREFVMQTQIRLTAVRKLITHTQQVSRKSSIGNGDSLPIHVQSHSGPPIGDTAEQNAFAAKPAAAFDLRPVVPGVASTFPLAAAELYPTSAATERLDAIKRRLAEQIQKN